MRIYDISQEVFACDVYEGDPAPQRQTLRSMDKGDLYNLTAVSMCVHNGTHIDAPLHFIKDGIGVEGIPLSKLVGYAAVVECEGDIDARGASDILAEARKYGDDAARRILIKGRATVSAEAARVLAASGVDLIGVESQSVGPEDAPMEVHLILLGANVVLLEGIRLGEVTEGAYLLHAAPLLMSSCDGAPCRATLCDIDL